MTTTQPIPGERRRMPRWLWLRRSAARGEAKRCTAVMLYALPKVVFLYPTAVAALICGLLTSLLADHAAGIGEAFLIVFILNMVVLGFEFPRTTSMTLFAVVAAIVLGVILINLEWLDLSPGARRVVDWLHPSASGQFYLILGVALTLVIGLAIFSSRHLDYWEVQSNEVIHHRGLLHGEERFGTSNIRFSKDITDVFEYWLLRAGRLIIHPAGSDTVVLDNVRGIHERADDITHVLSHLHVNVTEINRRPVNDGA